jgi:8-oxo-dGTP diphosphatase
MDDIKPENKKVRVGFGVMMMRDYEILLGRRHSDPAKADSELHGEGTWTMPGGKLEFGESFAEGARREVKEETGMELGQANVICVNNDKVPDAHFVTIGFFSKDFQGEPKVMEPDEIVEWRWFDLKDLPTPLYFPSKEIINNYQKGQFYISEQ